MFGLLVGVRVDISFVKQDTILTFSSDQKISSKSNYFTEL